MTFTEHEVRQIAEETWRVILGEELEPALKTTLPRDVEDCMAASAQVTGDCPLAVVLYCSTGLAKLAAASMFEISPDAISIEDIHDVMRELVNIITGNIKGLLTGENRMSLPSVVKGRDFKIIFPRHVLLNEVAFVCQGKPVIVSVLGENTFAARRQRGSENGALKRV